MVIIIVLLVITAFLFFCILPGKVSNGMKCQFSGRNYAHRGLYTEDGSVPENCLKGIIAAAGAGYGIEFDVHITSDSKLVVIHDNSLKRMCGIDGIVEHMTLNELRGLQLLGTDEIIPTFDEVLNAVSGRVPIIIELKTTKIKREALLCSLAAGQLDLYKGPFCIESFDPRIVAWFKKNRPAFIRGQLISQPSTYKGELNCILSFILYNGLSALFTRPHFISHCKGRKSILVRVCESLGAMKFVWTIHSNDDIIKTQNENDGVIFEFYRPEPRYNMQQN